MLTRRTRCQRADCFENQKQDLTPLFIENQKQDLTPFFGVNITDGICGGLKPFLNPADDGDPKGEDGPKPKFPLPPIPEDPTQPPEEEGWEWRGNGPPGSDKGAWYNPGTGESLHPDPDHGGDIEPHWDWIDPSGQRWRVFPDGSITPT